MYELTEETVKQFASEKIYNSGMEYYKDGQIVKFDVDRTYNYGYDCYIYDISARVKSKATSEIYNVHIKINERIGMREIYCNCEAFDRFYGVCKHTVAVLLKYLKEKDIILHNIYEEKLDNLMDNITSAMVEQYREKKEIDIDYKLYLDNSVTKRYAVELKIGENKPYIIKSISEFIDVYKGKTKSIQLSKSFIYTKENYSFSDCDRKVIDIIQEAYESQKMLFDEQNYYAIKKIMVGRKVYFTTSQLKRFLDIIKFKRISVEANGLKYEGVPIIEEALPLDFDMKIEKNKIAFKHVNSMPMILTEDGEYFFFEAKIYKVDRNFTKTYIPLLNYFNENRSNIVYFNKDDSEKIASYMIPSLKRIAKNIHIDSELESCFQEEPLLIKTYLDRHGDYVILKARFCYGELDIDPLKQKESIDSKRVLIRDIISEKKYLANVDNFGFTIEKGSYCLKGDEKILKFITEGVKNLKEFSEIYYTDAFKNMKIYNSSSYNTSIKLNDNNLLEFSFNIDGIDKNEIKNILKALKEKKKYYKLKKGSFLKLDEEKIQNIGKMLEYMDIKDSEVDGDKVFLSKYYAMYIDSVSSKSEEPFINKEENFNKLVENIKTVNLDEFKIPEHIDLIMRKYQKAGFYWLKTLSACCFGGILADEMGLGKTIQTISFILSEIDDNKPSIIIVPTSLVYNWQSEIEKFAPEIKTLIIAGSKKERTEAITTINDYNAVITSYPLIRRDIDEIKNIDFKYCILDEGQNIKNPTSLNAKCVKEIKASNRFVLTGTPIENSLTELWSIFDFLMPGYLLSHNKFVAKYEKPIIKDNDKDALDELNNHIKPFILRRLKSEVIKELPPKIEHSILVDMTDEQKKLYMSFLLASKNEINDEIKLNGFNNSKIKILSLLTRLRQICCEPSVFIEDYKGESGKMLALDDLLEETIGAGHRILLFSQFTSVLKIIEKRIKEKNIEYFYLDGSTPMRDRGFMVNDFNNGDANIFLISLKAGGTGLNLTGADTVIHFDPWWNPAVEDQASDRAHRIGQEKTVEVIKLVSKGTIEEKISKLQEKKKKMIQDVMEFQTDRSDVLLNMSEENIRELFEV